MIFRQQLRRGLVKPDGTKEGPFCMDTYRQVYCVVTPSNLSHIYLDGCLTAVASPAPKASTGVSHMRSKARRAMMRTSSYSAIIDHGRLTLHKTVGFSAQQSLKRELKPLCFLLRLLDVSTLFRQINHIYENSAGDHPGVGVLGANNRDVWAKVVTKLCPF